MSTKKFPKGSEWRKWDLHVHTPKSIISNYGGDTEENWDKFITDLESLPEEFKVIGINDYYFLDGYEKVREKKQAGRLQNIDLILPVIELRLSNLVGTEDELQKINYHVIFSDTIPSETITSQFIIGLKQKYKLSPTDPEMEWNQGLTRTSLEELGNLLIKSAPEKQKRKYDSPLREGFNSLAIPFESIKEKLDSSAFRLNGNPLFLTAVGKTEWDELKWSDGSIAVKKSIINAVDIIFTSALNFEKFNNAKDKLTLNEVNDCLIDCSDAHDYSNATHKDRIGNSFTWLKADPTFEGLRQVVKEKDSRIHIGDKPRKIDSTKTNTRYIIKSCNITTSTNDDEWFDSVKNIELSGDLISIIGNKGSGKSALADIIAVGGNANCTAYSFLTKEKFLAHSSSRKYGVTLEFKDGITTEETPLVNPEHKTELPSKVVYLSQSFVRDLCEDENPQRLQAEIDRVILGHVPDEEKRETTTLSELVARKTKHFDDRINEIKDKLFALNKKICISEEFQKENVISSLKKKLAEREQQLALHIKGKPKEVKKPAIEEAVSKELSAFTIKRKANIDRLVAIQTELVRLSTSSERLNDLKNRLMEIETNYNELVSEYKDDNTLKQYGLVIENLIRLVVRNESLVAKSSEIKAEIEKLRQEKIGTTGDNVVIDEKTQKINDSLGQEQKLYQDYLRTLSQWEEKSKALEGSDNEKDTIKFYQFRINYAENLVEDILTGFYNERSALASAILDQIMQKQGVLNELYGAVKDHARQVAKKFNATTEDFIDFSSLLTIKSNFIPDFLRFIHQGRSGSFYGKEDGQRRLQEIIFRTDFADKAKMLLLPETILQALSQVQMTGAITKLEIESQLAQGYTKIDVLNFLFSFDYITPTSEIKYSDKSIRSLSPGERGALMLIFYLLIDKDERPIIIDQPEENLDNQTVYERLVMFIKDVKERRQIIIVTHNPNLAIVCDSEQIIYASIDKKNKNRVLYESGSIEEPSIRKHVIDVLEGTKPAFIKRQDKYELN